MPKPLRRVRGTGSVLEVKGKYHARRRVHGQNEYGPSRDTRVEAEADLAAMVGGAKSPRKGAPSLQELAHEQALARRSVVAPATLATEETIRLAHIEGCRLGKMPVNRIRAGDLEEWIDGLRRHELRTVGGHKEYVRSERRLSPNSVRRVVSVVSRLLAVARREGWLVSNPLEGVRLPSAPERVNRVLSPDEARRFLVLEDRTDAVIVVLLMTGMRRSELCRLEWRHVEDGWLEVPGRKSAAAPGRVPLPRPAADAIAAQPRRSAFVFSVASGAPLGLRNLTRDVKARLVARGLPDTVRLHDLRGTFVSLLLESHADMRTAQELARHANPRTTQGMYARSRVPTKKAASDALARLVEGDKASE